MHEALEVVLPVGAFEEDEGTGEDPLVELVGGLLEVGDDVDAVGGEGLVKGLDFVAMGSGDEDVIDEGEGFLDDLVIGF